MIHKLLNIDGLTKEDIQSKVDNGATFVVFQYQVSIVALTYGRFSPAILIESANNLDFYRKKYNLKSFLYGPWFFPTGPFRVFSSIKANNKGGMNVTGEIMLNLDSLNTEEKSVEITLAYTLFDHLPKEEYKTLRKTLDSYCNSHKELEQVYVGKYINTAEEVNPPYIIGVKTETPNEELEAEILKNVYTKFRKFVAFSIIWEKDDPELHLKLIEQGQRIIDRTQN